MPASPFFTGYDVSDPLIDRMIGEEYATVKLIAEYIPNFDALVAALATITDYDNYLTALAAAVSGAASSASSASTSAATAASVQAAVSSYANAAATAAGASETSKLASAAQATAALASAAAALVSQNAAAASAIAAAASATSSASSAATAITAQTNATGAASAAQGWANQAQVIAEFDVTDVELISRKGQANGYPSLDVSGKVPTAQLPASILGSMNFQGVWNATTNTPSIPGATSSNKGWFYKVSVEGTTNVSGITNWEIGDWIVSNGVSWDKIDNTDSVISVAGLVGTVSSAALKGALGLVKADVGLGNVENKSSSTIRSELTISNISTTLGLGFETNAVPSTIPYRDSSGDFGIRHLYSAHVNSTDGVVAGGSVSYIMVKAGDNYHRSASAASIWTFLGLGNVASLSIGTGGGTVAAGDDSRFAAAAQRAANLGDLSDLGQARSNLGLGSLATLSAVPLATNVSGVLAIGAGGTGATDAAGARSNLGLGSLAPLNSITKSMMDTALGKSTARVNSGSATNSGLISWGTGEPGTLAEGEIYLRYA